MDGIQELLDASSIVSGLATVGGVVGWLAALTERVFGRRSVPFAEWVLHGAGIGGAVGLLAAAGYLLS